MTSIEYDKDFEKVMSELQDNFGWSNIDVLPDSYKDFLNDTIKAVKNCSIPAVVERSEQFICYKADIGNSRCSSQCIECGENECINK